MPCQPSRFLNWPATSLPRRACSFLSELATSSRQSGLCRLESVYRSMPSARACHGGYSQGKESDGEYSQGKDSDGE